MNDEDDYQSREESPYFGASINDSRGIYGWVFIGLGVFFIIAHRFNYSSWDEMLADNNFISRSFRFFIFLMIFIGGIGLLMRWFGSKTRPSNQLRNEFNDNSEEG